MNHAAHAIAVAIPPFFKDHHVNGRPVLPAVEAMESLVSHAGRRPGDNRPLILKNIRFDKFLFLNPDEPPKVLMKMTDNGTGTQTLTLASRVVAGKAAIARTIIHAALDLESGSPETLPPLERLAGLTGVTTRVGPQRIYREMVPFGPAYRNLRELLISPDGALARVGSPDPPDPRGNLCLGSPYVLDAAFHAACVWCQKYRDTVAFPVAMRRRDIPRPTRLDAIYTARIVPVQTQAPPFVFNIFILDDHGVVCDAVWDVAMRDVSGGRNKPPAGFYEQETIDFPAALQGQLEGSILLEREALAEFTDKTLSEKEKQRLAPMTPSRRQGYLAARLALKRLCRDLSGTGDQRPAQAIETVAPDGRRPQCLPSDGSRPYCSVSHDHRFAVAVAAEHPVGVDVEPISDKALKAPDMYMDEKELIQVDKSPLGREAAAFRIWSVKEAVAKALNWDLAETWQRVRVTTINDKTSRLTISDHREQTARHALIGGHLVTLLIMEDGA